MRKFLSTTILVLAGYFIGKRKGATDASKVLLDAHFKSSPNDPLVVKTKDVEVTVTKLQLEPTTEEESE